MLRLLKSVRYALKVRAVYSIVVGRAVRAHEPTDHPGTGKRSTRGWRVVVLVHKCGQIECRLIQLRQSVGPDWIEFSRGARGRSRTDTLLRAADFESAWAYPKCLILMPF